jgi:GNAT superfamily N-acetyltransferase
MRRMISIAPESPRQPDVLALMQRADEYALGLYPAESYYSLDVAALERPDVTLLVARDCGELAGIVALVDNGDGTAEIKRMFVAEQQRGRGVAAALLAGGRGCRGRVIRLASSARDRPAAARRHRAVREARLRAHRGVRAVRRRRLERLHGEAAAGGPGALARAQ